MIIFLKRYQVQNAMIIVSSGSLAIRRPQLLMIFHQYYLHQYPYSPYSGTDKENFFNLLKLK